MLRVLIAEDSLAIRAMLRDMITSLGYAVAGEAGNGEEAVHQFLTLRPDLVTMDVVMPKKNGIDAAIEILKFDPTALIVVCSAVGQEAMVMDAFNAGVVDFLSKPIRIGELASVIKKVIAARIERDGTV